MEILSFYYVAIKRYYNEKWQKEEGFIHFHPSAVKICSEINPTECPSILAKGGHDCPFMAELSDGTRFIFYLHEFGEYAGDEIFSEQGEESSSYANLDEEDKEKVHFFVDFLNIISK